MKKYFKAILCFALALVMLLSSVSIAFAKNSTTPVVMIHGMGGSGLYHNPNTDEELPVEGFNIASILGSGGLLTMLLQAASGNGGSPEAIIDAIADFMSPYVDIACDENGNTTNNVGIKNYWTDSLANHPGYIEDPSSHEPAIAKQICNVIGAENVFAFNYDWRLDACENAQKLNTFIDGVKAQTGKSKVTIVSASEGTIVAAAYIDAYKDKNDIERLVFVNGAFNGVNVTKVLKKDFIFDQEIIMDFLRAFTLNYKSPDTNLTGIKFLIAFMEDYVGNLCDYLNDVVEEPELVDKVYNDVLAPLGTLPAMWEFLPYNDFYDAVDAMSDIGFLDTSSGLYDKIVRYHYVQGRLESNLKELKNKGVDIAIIANYGLPGIPVTSAYAKQTDYLIDTELASVGATVADFEKTLDANGKYVSADGIIDASTCLFPDNTWFVKAVRHVDFWYDSEATKFLATLATTSTPLDIDNIEKETGVGQFIGTNSEQGIIPVDDSSLAITSVKKTTTSINSSAVKKSPPTGNVTDAMLIAFTVSFALTSILFILTGLRKRKAK